MNSNETDSIDRSSNNVSPVNNTNLLSAEIQRCDSHTIDSFHTKNNDDCTKNAIDGVLETCSIYSERCYELLKLSQKFLKDDLERLQQLSSGKNSNNRTAQYAQPGILYSGGIAVADLTTSNRLTRLTDRHVHSVSSSDDEEENNNGGDDRTSKNHGDDFSPAVRSEDEGSSVSEQSSQSSDNEEEDDDIEAVAEKNDSLEQSTSSTLANSGINPEPTTKNKIKNKVKSTMNEKQYEQLIRKHWETLPVARLRQPPFNSVDNITMSSSSVDKQDLIPLLELPLVLLPTKDDDTMKMRDDETSASQQQLRWCESYLKTLEDLKHKRDPRKSSVVIFVLRSGRFAGGVFGTPNTDSRSSSSQSQQISSRNCCLVHRTSVRYTVRKGQGKAQSAQDSQRRPKSMGAQLRRAGEIQLQEDVARTVLEWKLYIQQASFVFLSIPKTMQKYFFDATTVTGTSVAVHSILGKRDPRIRRVPLDVGRPTFECVCLIHSIVTSAALVVRHICHTDANDTTRNNDQDHQVRNEKSDQDFSSNESYTKKNSKQKSSEHSQQDRDTATVQKSYPALTDLHIAAMEGNVTRLKSMLEEGTSSFEEWKNQRAGEFYMTPLHLVSESTTSSETTKSTTVEPSVAAECVMILLEQMKCDPCIVDVRNRVPYFLATHDKVRDAFRMARAMLGEDYCSWDQHAKVGPPLTIQDIQARKEKEAEKKRKKRQRLKEQKEKEKSAALALEKQQLEQQQRQQQLEDAKRIRDGLQPKGLSTATAVPIGGRACDYCQTICVGRKRTQMFQRLNYWYCSTDCVNTHKRELMANAALARFGP